MATNAQRAHVKALCNDFAANAARLLYPPGDIRQRQDSEDWAMSETQLLTVIEHGGTAMLDCSETAAWWFRCAGLWPFGTPGFTGTWFDWLGRYAYTNAKQALVAAPVIFGRNPGHHMGVVYEPDPKHGNPLIAGHGRPGFDIRTLSDLEAEQAEMGYPGVTFLSIAHV